MKTAQRYLDTEGRFTYTPACSKRVLVTNLISFVPKRHHGAHSVVAIKSMKDIRCEVAVFHAQSLVEGFEDLMRRVRQ